MTPPCQNSLQLHQALPLLIDNFHIPTWRRSPDRRFHLTLPPNTYWDWRVCQAFDWCLRGVSPSLFLSVVCSRSGPRHWLLGLSVWGGTGCDWRAGRNAGHVTAGRTGGSSGIELTVSGFSPRKHRLNPSVPHLVRITETPRWREAHSGDPGARFSGVSRSRVP